MNTERKGFNDADLTYMLRALKLARLAGLDGEVPVGSLLVTSTGQTFESGNQVEKTGDPTAHAERLVIEMAGRQLGRHGLSGSTLYCTLEPCAMCAGSLVAGRVGRLVFATRDLRFGACRSLYRIADDPRMNHRLIVDEGILRIESQKLLQDFFDQCRLHF